MRFRDRADGGRLLARALEQYRDRSDVLVLALPRGGVPVASEVARALKVLMDVFIVRKLGVPGHEELAMGAIASGGVRALNTAIIEELNISPAEIETVAVREAEELQRRERLYRGSKPSPDVADRTIILVDDGLATGSTMKAAVAALRPQHPAKIVVAVPVAPRSTCNELRDEADEVVCTATPEPFYAVGQWYENFEQVADSEVAEFIRQVA